MTRRRKKAPSQSSRTNWILGGVIGTVVVAAVVVVVIVFRGPWRVGAAKMIAPADYDIVNSEEDVFHVSMPQGWIIKSGGRKDSTWMTAEKGGAKIKVNESLVGSLLGDISGAGNSDPNGPDENLPVSRVHETKQPIFAEEYGKYREELATMVQSRFGKTRRSAFSGNEGGSRPVRGYRATAMGAMTQITVVCTCSPGDWDVLEPAFAKVITSIGPGQSH
ncbi:MAG: hypothetical protein ACJ8C4_17025 [Gemmataceae bacterium]